METEKVKAKLTKRHSKKVEKQKAELEKSIELANVKLAEAKRIQDEATAKAEQERLALIEEQKKMAVIQHGEDISNPDKFMAKVIDIARGLIQGKTAYLSYEEKQEIKALARAEAKRERRKEQAWISGILMTASLVSLIIAINNNPNQFDLRQGLSFASLLVFFTFMFYNLTRVNEG